MEVFTVINMPDVEQAITFKRVFSRQTEHRFSFYN